MLKLWFMRPIRNPVSLKERLDTVEFFANSRNIEMISSLQDCLKHIKNIPVCHFNENFSTLLSNGSV
jgi:DNA mismatch repair ATPase MutS